LVKGSAYISSGCVSCEWVSYFYGAVLWGANFTVSLPEQISLLACCELPMQSFSDFYQMLVVFLVIDHSIADGNNCVRVVR